VGHLRVRGLGFPQFKAHYLNLALSMAGVCALAVQNARACRAAEESRAYQRMMLDILDVFYAPQGTPEDIGKVLEILQTFAGVDALALEVEGSGGPGWTRARGYPPRLMELDCRRCVDALAGNGAGAPPGGAMTNARGTLWMDDLGTECLCGVEGFRSAAFVRLPLREGFQGWLQLHHRGSGHFTQVLLERIEGAARTVSIGLERRWAESDLRTANQELEDRVRQRTGELDARNQELRQEVLERTRAEETRDKVEQQLLQSQKLEALGTLAGGIAHDFNNALTPIVSLADLELGTLPVDGPLHQHLEIIRDAAGRAKGLVDQILLFSRRKAPHLITLELKPLVEEILLLVRATFPATIEIRQNLGECGLVKGDPSQIHQVVLNLCTNAFHAMQESGGMLKVGLEGVSLEPGDLLCVQGLAPGPYARLEVSDTGVGMSPEVQARIFEPFFTTKGAGKGTGLGLSVVHGIVASCRGHIAVYSEPGLGTTFRVFLPLAGDGAAKWEEPAASTAVPRGSERILVVDDEGLIRTALCEILGSLGYGTRPAAGGAEALALFLEDPEAFDLVITDMTMPRMTGLELARRIRVRRPEARIVMCSGFSEQVGPEELSDHGIREFVQKPFAVALVAQAVRRELDR
jgi:signal transduction histidine kinase/ActR/RegA family two-component response regulator